MLEICLISRVEKGTSLVVNFDASVKEPFLYIGCSFAFLYKSGNFLEAIKRLHKLVIYLAKTFTPSFEKRPDRLSKLATLNTSVF